MSDTAASLKDTYAAAEPVSKDWYNQVARMLKNPERFVESMKLLQGYAGIGAVQVPMNVNGVIKWVTVNDNCA